MILQVRVQLYDRLRYSKVLRTIRHYFRGDHGIRIMYAILDVVIELRVVAAWTLGQGISCILVRGEGRGSDNHCEWNISVLLKHRALMFSSYLWQLCETFLIASDMCSWLSLQHILQNGCWESPSLSWIMLSSATPDWNASGLIDVELAQSKTVCLKVRNRRANGWWRGGYIIFLLLRISH